MTTIGASRVLTAQGWRDSCVVHVADGIVTAIQPASGPSPDRVVVPGFVDLQVNGIDDTDVATAEGSDWNRLDRLLLEQGVTAWCPTLVTTALERYAGPLASIAAAMQRPPQARPTIAGIHLEGPFLGAAPGAHRPDLIVPIDLAFLRSLPSTVALITLGAEQPLATEAIRLLTARGVVVSIGHSRATAEQFTDAVHSGARLVTHLFNAMGGLHHRDPGLAAWALTHDTVAASLIADGIHVHPTMLALAFRVLGRDRTVLITDSVAWRAGSVGPVPLQLADGTPRLANGTLAGSALTMDAAIRNCVEGGIALDVAIQAATANPRRVLGPVSGGDAGSGIVIGQPADLVSLDATLRIEQTWVAGHPTL